MPYGAIDHRIWTSTSIKRMSDRGKLAFAYVLTSPHSNMIGFYYLPISYMAHDLGWGDVVASKELDKLCEESSGPLAMYDSRAEVILIPRYLKYNPLATGNRMKGAIAKLRELPCNSLVGCFHASVSQFAASMEELLFAIEEIESSESLERFSEGMVKSAYTVADTDAGAVAVVGAVSEDFEKFWQHFLSMKRNVGKPAAEKAWATTLKGRPGEKGHPPVAASVLIEAANHYRMKCEMDGTDPKYIKQPATFLGPDRHWEDYKDVPSPSGNGKSERAQKLSGYERGADYYLKEGADD